MSRDRSLDEFLDAADGSEESESTETDDAGSVPEGETESSDDGDRDDDLTAGDAPTTPASVTYGWSPDGRSCARCGATVRRRWWTETDDGRIAVCADCKEW